jgi:hypothetical protein
MQFGTIAEMCLKGGKFEVFQNLTYLARKPNITKVQILRISKFRVNLWISYYFDDITTILGL